jgi:hypothetical protein
MARSTRRNRRGGAKPLRELVQDLERDPSKSTLENVLSDLEAHPDRDVQRLGATYKERLNAVVRRGGDDVEDDAQDIAHSLRRRLDFAVRNGQRGGAMTKPLRELVADLERDPSKSTLENVISDLRASDRQILRDLGIVFADQLRAPLAAGERMDDRVQRIIADTIRSLRTYGGGRRRKTRRRGGAMSKTLPELIADLERDPTKATLENVLSDLKAGDNPALVSYAQGLEENLREPLRGGETMEQRVRDIIVRITGFLGRFRGGRRKTTRRR